MKTWKRIKKSNNETLSILISTILGIVIAPFFIGFEWLGFETLTYVMITFFGFVSASSYLAKAIGKIIQHFKGEESNIFSWFQQLVSNQPQQEHVAKKNKEGWATLIAFILGVTLAVTLLAFDPLSLSEVFQELFNPSFARVIFVFLSGGLTASLASRFSRIFDQSKEDRKKAFFYNLFVIVAVLLSIAALIAFPHIFALAAWPMLTLAKAIFTSVTIVSTAVSMFNYIGRVMDQISQRHFSHETIATIAGIFLGLTIGAIIIFSSLATGGLTGLGVIGAVGFSKVLALSSGSILGKIAFGFFWTSITTGFCRRIGTLFDQIIMPGKSLKDVLSEAFVERTTMVHDFPLVAEESAIQITNKLKQVKPISNGSYQQIDDESDAANETSHSCFPLFNRIKKVVPLEESETEMHPMLLHRASTFNFG